MSTPGSDTALRRSLSLPLLVLYGLGTTIGAGIYALLGEVAGSAAQLAPWSFALASLLASFTAFSFCELSSRHPKSAGEAVYVREGLGRRGVASGVGAMVALAGCVSAATIANGFVGYLGALVELPRALSIVALVAILGGIAAWGIRESVVAAALVTAIEIVGLLLVLFVCREGLAQLPQRWPELVPGFGAAPWLGVSSGALLAFYAFLGFEDMVNVAEEVRDVRRTLPRAIVWTLLLTTVLYVSLATAAVLVAEPARLAEARAPLAWLYQHATGRSPRLLGWIGLLAMVNGALIQIVMASRVIYGLAGEPGIPARLGRIHPRTRTPLLATAGVSLVVAVLALWLPLRPLAEATSVITLLVFAAVNAALWRLQRRAPAPAGAFAVPRWVPGIGFAVSLGFVALRLVRG